MGVNPLFYSGSIVMASGLYYFARKIHVSQADPRCSSTTALADSVSQFAGPIFGHDYPPRRRLSAPKIVRNPPNVCQQSPRDLFKGSTTWRLGRGGALIFPPFPIHFLSTDAPFIIYPPMHTYDEKGYAG